MRVIDLFCGCGGLSKGFQEAGHTIVAAFDNWQSAINVYGKNFQDHPIINYDLSTFEGNAEVFGQFEPEMIIGGPPCQDFSSAGKRDETLGRADLTYSFAQIVSAVKPVWFIMENVDRAIKSVAFANACSVLKEAGYGLTTKILDASYCGVPQIRKRLFLIGELHGQDDAVEPYLARNLTKQPLTVKDYLGEAISIEHYYRHPRSYFRRAIFAVNEPSPTVRGVNRPIPATYRLHPGDTAPVTSALRPLTTKERSLIQTFPTDFIFEGTKAEVEQMLGNAVPVKLAQYVANCIGEYIENGLIAPKLALATPKPTQLSFEVALV